MTLVCVCFVFFTGKAVRLGCKGGGVIRWCKRKMGGLGMAAFLGHPFTLWIPSLIMGHHIEGSLL